MARVNVDDGFYCDPRFLKLCAAVGDAPKAVGLCVLAWRLAQKFWADGNQLIPPDEFSAGGFDQLIDAGLARLQDGGVYVRGTELQFAWLAQKRSAGRRGGEAKAAKQKLADASGCLAEPGGCLAGSSGAYPLTLALTPTLSLKRENRDIGSSPEPVPDGTSSADADVPPPLISSPPPQSKQKPSDFDYGLADEWGRYAADVSRTVRFDREKWAQAVRLLRVKNKFTEDEIRALLDFARSDPFWRPLATSLPALRTPSKNGLLKVENLLNAARAADPNAGSKNDFEEFQRMVAEDERRRAGKYDAAE